MSVTTSVSAAMLPVVTAATSTAAMTALGISPAMQSVVGAPTLSSARAAFGGSEINISWFGAALDNVTDDSCGLGGRHRGWPSHLPSRRHIRDYGHPRTCRCHNNSWG